MTIWIKSRFYIAEFLLNFADPPYARVCIETLHTVPKNRLDRPALRAGLYRNSRPARSRASSRDPPYARVCIETYIKLYLKDLMYRPTSCVGLYRNCTAQRRFRKFSDPPYVWICIETISVNYEKRGDTDPLYVRVCIETISKIVLFPNRRPALCAGLYRN